MVRYSTLLYTYEYKIWMVRALLVRVQYSYARIIVSSTSPHVRGDEASDDTRRKVREIGRTYR